MQVDSQKLPELLAPVGSLEQFMAGLTYGADAFYLSTSNLSLRAQTRGFSWDDLDKALILAHGNLRKVYYCLNLFAYEKHLSAVKDTLIELQHYPIDGLIIADPGVINLAQEYLPNIPIHLSTQANTSNSEAIKFWQQHGVTRVNLARELDYKAIRAIKKQCPNTELEVFVHGAMCMAISGRCVLSKYLNDRSANLGLCTNPCRFNYKPYKLIVEESERPNQPLWELEEDQDYTHILAADDLCLVKYINWFKTAQIDCLKIEGRTKSEIYTAQVVDVYKTAILDSNRRLDLYMDELQQIGDRDFSNGFFMGHPKKIAIKQKPSKPIFAKIIEKQSADKWLIQIKTPWHIGKNIQIMKPGLERPEIKAENYMLENEKGEQLSSAHPGTNVYLRAQNKDLKNNLFLRYY